MPWVIPLTQTLHILAITVVVGSVGFLDLRVLGLALRSQDGLALLDQSLPRAWVALVVLLATGSILVVGEPDRSLGNPTFQLKMTLLLVAIGLTLALARSLRQGGARTSTRLIAAASLLVWVAIIFAGRWIAYTVN